MHPEDVLCNKYKDEIIAFHREVTRARFLGEPHRTQRQFIVAFLESKRHEVVQTETPTGRTRKWAVKDWLLPAFERRFKQWVLRFVMPQLAFDSVETPEQFAQLEELLNNTVTAVSDGSDLTQIAMEFGLPANTFRAMLRQAAKYKPEFNDRIREAMDDSYENSVNEYRMMLGDPTRTPEEKALAKEALAAKRMLIDQSSSRFGVNNNPQGKHRPTQSTAGISIDFTYSEIAGGDPEYEANSENKLSLASQRTEHDTKSIVPRQQDYKLADELADMLAPDRPEFYSDTLPSLPPLPSLPEPPAFLPSGLPGSFAGMSVGEEAMP
jgi:hypothetical protein